MFLKSLTMKGFKSFADPTVLEFEPGITVVVGPNGSGKSNVVDAVTWVLGAQGPRSLRSQKMEDVIFAGTSSRPALGRAEVSLTIDNASGRLPVDMAEVTITRVLFRSGDSEYAINGMPCRLLDVQELLADSGVGRQQHMIIGQGQLDSVLSARPEDRRTVIEEAAGVLKHRRRKERAERRLAGAQENLERLGDLVRELRRQIRPLERQAAAARRHAALEGELRALRLHLAGRELSVLAASHGAATAELAEHEATERASRAELAVLDDEARSATAELASRRQGDLADTLGRLQGLSERARGTVALCRERSRGLAQALDAAFDSDVVSTLEADAARVGAQLAECEEGRRARVPALEAAVARHDHAVAALEALRDAREVPEAASAESELRAVRQRVDLLERTGSQHAAVVVTCRQRVDALEARMAALDAQRAATAGQLASMRADADEIAAGQISADAAAGQARAAADRAGAELARAEEQQHRASARAEALERALRDLEGSADRAAVSGSSGLAGVLAELVDVDPGYEDAFAAAGAPASALVVHGEDAARSVLARLASAGSGGSVVAVAAGAVATGGAPGSVPDGAELVRAHVRARPGPGSDGLDAALDRLLAGALCVSDWREAVDLVVADPARTVVTVAGDRFSGQGWRVRSGSPVVTRSTVERAQAEAADAAAVLGAAVAAAQACRAQRDQAAAGAARAGTRLAEHRRRVAELEQAVSRLGRDHERVVADLEDARAALDDAQQRDAQNAAERDGLRASMPELESRAAAAQAAADRRHQAIEAATRTVAEQATVRHELEQEVAAASERRRILEARLAEVERRLTGHVEEREAAARRRQRLEADAEALHRLERLATGVGAEVAGLLETVRVAYREQLEAARAGGEHLDQLRRRRVAVEQRMARSGSERHRVDVQLSEIGMRTRAITEMIARELGSTPEAAVRAPAPEVPDGVEPAAHAAALSEELAAMGPVNPLALDELSELEERHQELAGQVEDVQTARRELHQVIRHLDEEIMATFVAAVSDVNEHFSTLVATLFPGGTGRLELTDPDDLLHTGVEVEVRPPGRNVRRVSLLSGGERSLVALAFLFAVFRSRPSPFYLMDEVEAALDDVNLQRFLQLVREFRAEAQLIVVSHQKRTMETGDALYGVTMAPGGSSKVLSQKVDKPAVPDAAAARSIGTPTPASPALAPAAG